MLRYFAFYKPYQVLCQFSPSENKRTLSEFFPALPTDIYPVGRLDYDSEGLLLLTNDKALTHRLLEPKFAHPRTYLVQVEGAPDAQAIAQLRSGVRINVDGQMYQTKKAMASIVDPAPQVPDRDPPIRYRASIPTTWIRLTLTEGKNRQVRRMTAAIGFPTLRLVRESIGALHWEGLQPGSFREYPAAAIGKLLLGG